MDGKVGSDSLGNHTHTCNCCMAVRDLRERGKKKKEKKDQKKKKEEIKT